MKQYYTFFLVQSGDGSMIDLSFPKRGRRGGCPTPSTVKTQLPPFYLCVSIDNRITYSKNVVNYKIESYAPVFPRIFSCKIQKSARFRKFKKVRKTLLYQQKTVFGKCLEYRFLWDGCPQRTANAREKAEKRRTSTTRIACRGSRLAGVVKTQFYEMP